LYTWDPTATIYPLDHKHKTHVVFTHGDSRNTTVDFVYYNGSEAPNFQGATNHDIRDASGESDFEK
jgi:hypothetical protein